MRLKNIIDNEDESCCVVLSRQEYRLLTNSLNEVVNGIRGIDYQRALSVSWQHVNGIHQFFLDNYDDSNDSEIEFFVNRGYILVLQKVIIAVMHDFNYDDEYSIRLGIEFDEYLDLLFDVNVILEESCKLMMLER